MVGSVYSREVGDDNNITFGRDVWVEKSSLKDKYPRPFLLFEQHDAMLKDMGLWEEGVWQWSLSERRHFFIWEEWDIRDSLEGDINAIAPIEGKCDGWRWEVENLGLYMANSSYCVIHKFIVDSIANEFEIA